MSVLKLSKSDIIRGGDEKEKEGKLKLKKSDIMYDTTPIGAWENTNKQSLDILNDYNSRINKNEWLSEEDREAYRKALDSYVETSNYLRGINKSFGTGYTEEEEKEWTDSIASMKSGFEEISNIFSKYTDWDDYKQSIADAQAWQKDYEAKLNYNLEDAQNELDRLNGILSVKDEITSLKNDIAILKQVKSDPFGNHRQELTEKENRLKAMEDTWAHAMEVYGSEAALSALASEKNSYYTLAKRVQDGVRLAGVSNPESEYYDPNFEKYSALGNNVWWENVGDTSVKNSITIYDDIKAATLVLNEKWLGTELFNVDMLKQSPTKLVEYNTENTKTVDIFREMNEDELATLAYYLGKDKTDGTKLAEQYIDSIKETLNARMGEKIAATKDNLVTQYLFSIEAGIDQFIEGRDALFSGEDYIPTSAIQYASGEIRENLKGEGIPFWYNFKEGKWENEAFGSSTSQIFYDALNTTSNMLPSILASTAINFALPGAGVGAYVGVGVLGMSAAGNAKAEMLKLGYSKEQANSYGLMVGASEALLEKVLGGIPGLKGADGVFSSLGQKILGKIDNAFARAAITIGGNMLDEGLEEGLQTVIEPWLKEIATNVDWEAANIDEVLYSSLLGALSSSGLSGVSTVAGTAYSNSQLKAHGQSIIDKGGTDTLKELALEMAGVNQNKQGQNIANLVGKVATKASAKNVGKLSAAMNSINTAQNKADIQSALVKKGMSTKDAERVAEYLASGEALTKKQQAEVNSNKNIKDVVNELLSDPNSAISERTRKLLYARIGVGATSKSNVASNATTSGELSVKKATDVSGKISESGKTIIASTGESVTINKNNAIAKTKIVNGERVVYYNTDKGVVASSDIKYGNESEGLLYEGFVDMNPAFANAVIKNYDGSVPIQTYINGMREGVIVYGMHNFQSVGKDISGASYLAELSKADQDFALKLGRAYAKSDAKKAGSNLRTAIKNAAKRAEASETTSSTEGAKKTPKKGAVRFENGAKVRTKAQRRMASLAKHLASAIGIDIVFYDATIKGTKHSDSNGYFDEETNAIHLDLQNAKDDAKTIAFTLSHELVHFVKKNSPSKFNTFANFLMQQYAAHGVDSSKLLANKMAELGTTDADFAYEEMICDACETMLLDSNAVVKLMELRKQDLGLFETIKLHILELLNKIRDEYRRLGLEPTSDEAKALLKMEDVLDKIHSMFEEALVEATENYQAVQELNTDSVSVSEDGTIKMQMKQYQQTGRATLLNYLREQYGDENANDLIFTIDNIYDTMKEIKNDEALSVFSNWQDTEIELDEDGHPIFTTSINNGDYELNQDFSRVCKKRRQLDFVLNMLAEDPAFEASHLTKQDFVKINKAIKEHGFEIACALCFVDSKRFRQAEWADSFANTWNDILNAVVVDESKLTPFNFATKNPNLSDDGIEIDTSKAVTYRKWSDGKEDVKNRRTFDKFDQMLSKGDDGKWLEGNANVRTIATLIRDNPELRHTFRGADIIASKGFDTIQRLAPGIRGILDGWGGSSVPKPSSNDASYDSSIINISGYNKETAYAMGGVRMNSFSDFMAHMFFDYCQAFADLSAKELPSQAYTKELIYVRLFGRSGQKINMSGIAAIRDDALPTTASKGVTKAEAEANEKIEKMIAGLDVTRLLEYLNKDILQLTETDVEQFLDMCDYVWADESINMKHATLLQTGILYDKLSDSKIEECYELLKAGEIEQAIKVAGKDNVDAEYAKNCGTIVVGVSDAHIRKLLRDPTVRMVIPYHKSGLNPIIARELRISAYNDYTLTQTTGVKRKGSKTSDKIGSKTIKDSYGLKDFAFYDWFGKTIDGKLYDGKATADKYLEWCEKGYYDESVGDYVYYTTKGDGYILAKDFHKKASIVPKFDAFVGEENYYKVLEDFDCYNTITGEHSAQGAVDFFHNGLPSDYKTVLVDALKEEQKVHDDFRDHLDNKGLKDEVMEIVKAHGYNPSEMEQTWSNIVEEVGTENVAEAAEQYTDVENVTRIKKQKKKDSDNTYENIGKELMYYEEGDLAPDLTLVETINDRTGKKEVTIKHHGQKPKGYIPKKIAYCYKLFEQHPDGTLHALFAGAKNSVPIGEWRYAQGFPRTDDGVSGMDLRERYGWHLSAGLPSAPHLMSSKYFERGYPSKGQYGHPKHSKRVWVRMAYDASMDFNGIADSTGAANDIYGLIPFGGYYAFKENNQSEWVISSAVKIDKILTEEERQQILKDAGYDEYEAWRVRYQPTAKERAARELASKERAKAKAKAKKLGIETELSESTKAMRESIKSRIIDNPELNKGIKKQVKRIVGNSGKDYGIGVYLDSTLLTNLTDDERVQMVKEYVKELGGKVFTAYDQNHKAVDVHIAEASQKFKNNNGKRVPVNKDLTSYLGKIVKQESIALVDELILTSTLNAKEPSLHSHDWLDNYGRNDWEYWVTYVQDKENTIWEATLNIATTTNGERILYDIVPIKMVEQSVTSDTSTTIDVEGVEKIDTTSTDGSITQPKPIVKKQLKKTSDQDYLDAVNRGDMATAQRMVDEAAKEAGYTVKAFHGTRNEFTVFDQNRSGKNYKGWSKYGRGFYFAESTEDADHWSAMAKGFGDMRTIPAYLRMENPFVLKPEEYETVEIMVGKMENLADYVQERGYDSIISPSQYVVFNPEQIKSSDPVTYDDNGNVIPLSERFNSKDNDIRFQKKASNRDNVGYHAGDLGKAEYYFSQGSYRGTGHFGTGTYFVGDEEKISGSGEYGRRPHHAVDFSDYNLYKIKSDKDGWDLHEQLGVIEDGVSQEWIDAASDDQYTIANYSEGYEIAKKKYGEEEGYSNEALAYGFGELAKKFGIEVESKSEFAKRIGEDDSYAWLDDDYVDYLQDTVKKEAERIHKRYSKFRDAYFYLWLRFGKSNTNRALQKVALYQAEVDADGNRTPFNEKQRYADSLATVFMKALGYEGIDVRGTKLDNVEYGSVIYDLKDDTVLYQKKKLSNRTILANALEGIAENDIEKNKLTQYKKKIELIESEQAKLNEIRAKANELRFTKGRTPAETKTMRDLDAEANQIANRISTYDKQLLNLESTTALKGVLEREKAMLRKRLEQKGKESLAAYREKATKTQRELLTRYQESRTKAIEGRNKTEMRHKIKKVVSDLNQLLLHGSKERNIKLGLQQAVASALDAINMDTVSAESRIAKLTAELMKAKTPEKIEQIQHSIDYIKNMGDKMSDKLEALRKAYNEIKNSADNEYSSQFKEEASLIEMRIESVIKKVGNTPLRDMSLYQLEQVHDMYKMVLTTIRNANSVWKDGKLEDLQQNASAVMEEIDTLPKIKDEGSKLAETVRSFKWNEMIPYYAFDRIGSKTLMSFFDELIRGQNTYGRDVAESKAFADKTRAKYNYKNWKLDEVHDFKLKDGRTFRTTLKHMLSIYAYSKRDQALDHMSVGGFFHNDKATFRKKGGVLEMVRIDEVGYKVDSETLAEIKSAMTNDQLNYVDEMQDYLTKMGDKGNEVTRVLWGIDIFKEKVYFPLKSKNDFIKKSTETAQNVSLKNDGMTKEIVPGASNPIVLEAFDDVWASHVDRMSQYHAFVIPIDNLNKIHQYGTWAGTDSMAVSTMLAGRFGSAVNEYITQFIKDMNGGVANQGVTNPFMSMFSKFKKTAVGASLSTVVQQPTAIIRAMSIVDLKYFVGKPNLAKLSSKWEELKTYAPVAIIKEIGGFDAGGGKQTARWINTDALTGIDKVMNTIDDLSMKGAEVADQIGWTAIWEAIKRETMATTNLKVGSKEFLEKCGDRFTEVITKTQVYDSTLSRSGFMRSKNDGAKMLTAFMGEPTVSINMMYNAVINAKRGGKEAKLKAAKTIGCVYLSTIFASALASAIYALRDDDEDESYLEKYLQSLGGEVISDIVLAPITSLPGVKDAVSIFQGWDVERSDMAIFKDIKDAFDGLGSENKSTYRKIEDFAGAIASAFGLPVKNVLRTGREMYNAVNDILDGIEGGNASDAFLEGITGQEASKTKKLYEALINGDDARLELLKKGYKDDDSYNNAVRKALREHDSRINEAAQARLDGKNSEYKRIVKEIIAAGNFSQDIVVAAINAEITAIKKKANEKK